MPDSKISGLTSATTPLAGTEVLPIVQSGVTKQVSVANLTAGRSVDASTLTVTGNTYLATTSGNVGIGTTGPSVKLQVNGTSNGATLELLRLSNIGTGANTKSRLNFYAASTNYGSITGGYGASAPEMVFDINTTAGAYIWNNNATEQMRITSVGNVGIGTSSPGQLLVASSGTNTVIQSVSTNTANSGRFRATNADGNNFDMLMNGSTTATNPSCALISVPLTTTPLLFYMSGVERMRLSSVGFGIGTNNPAALLHVSGAGTTQAILTSSDQTTTYLRFTNTTHNGGYIGYTSDNLIFLTGSSERMRITTAGSVGIGTSAPATTLDVNGGITGAFITKVYPQINTWYTNLGDPSVLDVGATAAQMVNNFRFVSATSQEQSTDGVTWTTSTRATAQQLADLMLGRGNNGALNIIPGGTIGVADYYRLTWDAVGTTGYCYLNFLWMYTATQGNTVTVLVERYNNSTALWETVGTGAINTWPGHSSMRHTNIAYNSGAGFYSRVRITFSTTRATANAVILNAIEWSGNYPGTPKLRDLYSVDSSRNATFPSQVRGTALVPTGSTVPANGMYLAAANTLTFATNTAERMRITSTGDVGIGTSSPGAKLDVAGAARVQGDFFVYGTGDRFNVFPQTAGSGVNVVSTNNANSAYAQLAFDGVPLIFKVAGTERMRLDSSGNLGIGTSSPGYKLDVSGTGRFTSAVSIRSGANAYNILADTTNTANSGYYAAYNASGTRQGYMGYWDASGYSIAAESGNALLLWAGGSERLRITSAGDVGIGTSSPASKLHVVGDIQQDNANYIKGKLAAGTATRLFGLNAANSLYIGGIDASQSETLFVRGGTTQMALDASGNLGVGTSSPFGKLTIKQTASQLDITTAADNVSLEALDRGTLGNAVDLRYYARNGNHIWYNGGYSERMRINSSGNLGLGVTPSASDLTLFQINAASTISAANNEIDISQNAVYSAGWKYITSATATRYQQYTGYHAWFNAASGTAGNAVSFTQAMTLNASGNLMVGTTTADGMLTVVAPASTGYGAFDAASSGFANLNFKTAGTIYAYMGSANAFVTSGTANDLALRSQNNFVVATGGGTERLRITSAGNIHTPAGSTSMTDGFIYIPSAGGTPTGAATAITGTVPLYYDTTNNKLFVYNSSWQNVATAGSLPLLSTNANGVVYLNGSSQATTSSAFVYNSSGYLGVNKTSPAYYLDVTTSSRVTGGIIVTGLTTPTAPSGAGSTTGGSLAAATYYAKVIALDVNTGVTTISAESTGVTTTGSTSSIVWTWTAVAGAVSYQLYFGTTSGTGYNTYFTTATNSYTLTTTAGASTNIFGQPSASAPGTSGTITADGVVKGTNLQAIGNNPTGGLGALLWNGSNNANAISNLLFGNDVSFVVSGIYQYPSTATIANEMRVSNGQNAPISLHTNGSERMRITGGGNFLTTQAAHSTVNTATTLNITQVQSGIIVSTPATNITITLPTGTTLESYTASMPVGFSFELTIILVTGSGGTDITIAANGNTYYGGANVTFNGPATLRFRKTATNTFTVYRIA